MCEMGGAHAPRSNRDSLDAARSRSRFAAEFHARSLL
jgi:hypothetical protein